MSVSCPCMSSVCFLYILSWSRRPLAFARMSSVCHSYVPVYHSYVLVCYSYVLICHLYLTHMSSVCYSCVIRMSLVCTCMSLVCHSYVLLSNLHVTCIYSYVICMSCISGFTINLLSSEQNKLKEI